MPSGHSCCHLEERLMHYARLIGVVSKSPQEPILDQKAVSLGYLVQWPRRVLTPYVNNVQLQEQSFELTPTIARDNRTWKQARHKGCALTHMILIAIQYLKSSSQSLSTCSVAPTSVRHQHKYPLLSLASAFSCRYLRYCLQAHATLANCEYMPS